MARELSFSVDRLLHQPSKDVVPPPTLGALSLFNFPGSICGPPHHSFYVASAAMPLVTQLLQQRSSLVAATIPTTLWGRPLKLDATKQENNEEQMFRERENRNFLPCRSVSPCPSSSSKDEEEYVVQEFTGVNRPVQSHEARNKKSRTTFTSNQLQELEKRFNQQKYLTKMDRLALAKSLSLTEKHVKTWYQNRRTKWKKDCSEDTWSKEREYAAANMYRQHLQMKSYKRSLSTEQQTSCQAC